MHQSQIQWHLLQKQADQNILDRKFEGRLRMTTKKKRNDRESEGHIVYNGLFTFFYFVPNVLLHTLIFSLSSSNHSSSN